MEKQNTGGAPVHRSVPGANIVLETQGEDKRPANSQIFSSRKQDAGGPNRLGWPSSFVGFSLTLSLTSADHVDGFGFVSPG